MQSGSKCVNVRGQVNMVKKNIEYHMLLSFMSCESSVSAKGNSDNKRVKLLLFTSQLHLRLNSGSWNELVYRQTKRSGERFDNACYWSYNDSPYEYKKTIKVKI